MEGHSQGKPPRAIRRRSNNLEQHQHTIQNSNSIVATDRGLFWGHAVAMLQTGWWITIAASVGGHAAPRSRGDGGCRRWPFGATRPPGSTIQIGNLLIACDNQLHALARLSRRGLVPYHILHVSNNEISKTSAHVIDGLQRPSKTYEEICAYREDPNHNIYY